MIGSLIVVKAAYDPEARVWFVEDSDLHGLNAEGTSLGGIGGKAARYCRRPRRGQCRVSEALVEPSP
jgi:hypothetical protein